MKNSNILTIHRDSKCQRKSDVCFGQLNKHFSVNLEDLDKEDFRLNEKKKHLEEIYL